MKKLIILLDGEEESVGPTVSVKFSRVFVFFQEEITFVEITFVANFIEPIFFDTCIITRKYLSCERSWIGPLTEAGTPKFPTACCRSIFWLTSAGIEYEAKKVNFRSFWNLSLSRSSTHFLFSWQLPEEVLRESQIAPCCPMLAVCGRRWVMPHRL